MTRPTWQYSAPCASADPDAWFPEDGENAGEAKRVCGACPYQAPCLLEAMERNERAGIWGGVDSRHFRALRRELGIDTPRRNDAAQCGPDHGLGENRYIDPAGKLRCRECGRNQVARYRQSKRVPA